MQVILYQRIFDAMKRHSILIFVLSLLLCQSCNKYDDEDSCHNNLLGVFQFSTSERNIIPYYHSDTLRFRSIQKYNDSLVFIFQSRYSDLDPILENINNFYYDKCWGNYYECEDDYVSFINDSLGTLFFDIQFSDPFQSHKVLKYFTIFVENGNYSEKYFGVFCIQGDSIFNNPSTLYSDTGLITGYHNSFTIDSSTFYNVYELKGADFQPPITNYIATIYYSIVEGVVGFKFNTGEIYVLKIKNAIRTLPNAPEATVRGKLVKKGGRCK
jgi:hypothetical protein